MQSCHSQGSQKYIKGNDIKLAIDSGDVMVSESLTNQKIDTGHRCSKTAMAKDGRITAKSVDGANAMLDGDVYKPLGTAFMAGIVPHEVTLTAGIEVRFGQMVFGNCIKLDKKTCGIEGSSKGFNDISVSLAASECIAFIRDGKEYVEFKLDATIIDETNITSYKPMTIPKGKDCKILGGLASINSYIKKYGDRYLNSQQEKIVELRGTKLVEKLEDILKAKLGELVELPVNIEGKRRRKRSASKKIPKCRRKKCPLGFNRVQNSEMCAKFMGIKRPDCTKFGEDVKLFVMKPTLSRPRPFFLCYTTMS